MERLNNFLNEPQSSKASFGFSVVMALLIVLSSITFVMETEPFVYKHDNTKDVSNARITFIMCNTILTSALYSGL